MKNTNRYKSTLLRIQSFSDNYRALLIASVLIVSSICATAQNNIYDSTKTRQNQNSYGFDWKNGRFIGSFIAPRNLPTLAVADSGGFAYSQKSFYGWDGFKWFLLQGSGYDARDSTSRRLSGHLVYDSNLTWHNTPNFSYKILGRIYTAPYTVITLADADATYPRWDIIVGTSSGTIDTVKGVPSMNPVKPVIDPETQLTLLEVNVGAGATVPTNISNQTIYAENIEWPGATDIPGGLFNYTFTPHAGLLSTYIPATFQNGGSVSYTDAYTHQKGNYSFLKLWVRPIGATQNNARLNISFYNEDQLVSTPAVTIMNGIYNYDASRVNIWQEVVIPMQDFNFTAATFNQVAVTFTNSSSYDLQIDDIMLQAGGGTSTSISADTTYFDSCHIVVRKEISGALHDSVYFNSNCAGSGGTGGITQGQLDDTAAAIRADFPTGGGTGSVTTVSDLSPLFTTSNPTTTPTFSLSNAAGYTIFGNRTSSSAAPSYFTNPFLDSIKTSADSLYAHVNGQWRYQFSSRAFDSTFLRITANGLGATQVANKGLLLKNYTPATVGTVNQLSPALVFSSESYGTTLGTSQTQEWRIDQLPATATAPNTTLRFGSSKSGAAFVNLLVLNSNGLSTLVGTLTAGSFTATSTVTGGALSITGGSTFGNILLSTIGQNNTTSVSGLVTNAFANTGTINNTTGTSTHRGFYYAPVLTSLVGTNVIGFENTVGINKFHSVSGSSVFGGTVPHSSAKVDIQSTTQGFLAPHMTKAQRNAIPSPADGLMVIVIGEVTGAYLSYYNSVTPGWEKVNTTAD